MKKIYIIFIAAFAIAQFSYAQSWSGNGTDLYFNTSGKVGIGTSSPAYKLQVNGDISVNSSSNYVYTSKIGSYTGDLTINAGGSGNNLILTGGNVGIGTTGPENGYKLDVNGLGTIGTPGSARLYMGTTDATHAVIQSRDLSVNQNLTFYASSYNFAVGNVGIGTTPSGSSLTVASSGSSSAGYFSGGVGGTNPVVKIDISAGQSSPAIDLIGSSSTYPSVVRSLNALQLLTQNNGNILLTPTGTGNVGIGTISPDQKLTVNGTIHSKEVKVDNSIPIPDYVFEKNYNLPDLSQLKTYLEGNHHLPEIPSAVEIEKNGLNLGEMNLKLLKKVEELTLYLIEQNKQSQQQDKQLKKQQAINKSLQRQINQLKNLKSS